MFSKSLTRAKSIIIENQVLFALALIIRIIFAPITGHPYDLPIWINSGISIANGISPYAGSVHIGQTILWPLWTGLCYVIASLIEGLLGKNPIYYIFLIKLLPIFIDLILPIQIIMLIENYNHIMLSPKTITHLLLLILFNPVFIIVSSFWAMIDNLALSFVLLSINQILLNHTTVAGICIAFSISLKLYPVIFIPPLAIVILWKTNRIKEAFEFIFVSIFCFLSITYIPFYVFSWNSQQMTGVITSQLIRKPGGIALLGIITLFVNNAFLYNYFIPFYQIIQSLEIYNYFWFIVSIIFSIYLLKIGPKNWLPQFFQKQFKIHEKNSFYFDLTTLLELSIFYYILWYLTATWVSEQNTLPLLGLILVYYFQKECQKTPNNLSSEEEHIHLFTLMKKNGRFLNIFIQLSITVFLFISFNVPLFNFFYVISDIFTNINYNSDFEFLRSTILIELSVLFLLIVLKIITTEKIRNFLSNLITMVSLLVAGSFTSIISTLWLVSNSNTNINIFLAVFSISFILPIILAYYLKKIIKGKSVFLSY